jgi:methyl-accepting chemotaxis protein
MKWITNLNMSRKLAIGFGSCLFLALLGGAVALNRMSEMQANTKLLENEALVGTSASQDIQRMIMEHFIAELNIRPDGPAKARAMFMKTLPEAKERADTLIDEYEARAHEPEDISSIKRLKANWIEQSSFDSELCKASLANNEAKYNEVLTRQFRMVGALRDDCFNLVDWNVHRSPQFIQKADAAYQSARVSLMILLLAALIFGILVSTFISRGITGTLSVFLTRFSDLQASLAGLAINIEAMGNGDLVPKNFQRTEFLSWDRKDEFGKLACAFDQMLMQAKKANDDAVRAQVLLADLIGDARMTSETIATGAKQLAIGNEDLANRTTEQASSLEETAASMEEMTSIVKMAAENAVRANSLSIEARRVALGGGEVVRDAVLSMHEINKSSKKIADIVTVIDEIAFQTNLLALNAAVEAARVGEQGKGFAVVASEVRSLAGRSSTAAKEIKSLVKDSVIKVEGGAALVNKSGEQLRAIVDAVDKVAEIVSEISVASQEQSTGIEQVNKAVIQLDEITQQNAALVEESSAASQTISNQAADLTALVSRFKLDESKIEHRTTNAPRVVAASTGTHGAVRQSRPRTKLSLTSESPRRVAHNDMDEF